MTNHRCLHALAAYIVIAGLCLNSHFVDCGMTSAFHESAKSGHSQAASTGNWNWTQCYGAGPWKVIRLAGDMVNQYPKQEFPGIANDFVVAINSQEGTASVLELRFGKVVNSISNMSGSASYTLLPNGLLLQTGLANMSAWSVPELELSWSIESLPNALSDDIIFSAAGQYFCMNNGTVYAPFPVCFNASDGSFLWSPNGSFSGVAESEGLLIAWINAHSGEGSELGVVATVMAIEVVTGTYLWSQNATVPILVHGGFLLLFANYSAGTAMDAQTGKEIWTKAVIRNDNTHVSVTQDGVLLTSAGAYYLANGSCLWTFPPEACQWGAIISQRPDRAGGKFLCYYGYPEGMEYRVGDLATGELSRYWKENLIASGPLFGGELGFYFFAQKQSGDQYTFCLHRLNE